MKRGGANPVKICWLEILEITLMVENELRKIEESGEALPKDKKTQAYLSVAERLKDIFEKNMENETSSNGEQTSRAPGHERVAEIYRTYKELIEEFG